MLLRSALTLTLAISAAAFAPSSILSQHVSSSALNMVAIDTSDIKNGLTVEIDGMPHKVLNFSIMKQARGAAKITIKFKNLTRGNTIENTYRSGEKFQTALVEKQKAQFTYADENNNYFFMDMETFDEVVVGFKVVEEKQKWIDEGMEVNLVSFDGQVIDIALPPTATYTVAECDPTVVGNTANAVTKPATLSSGAVVQVPGYVSQGEAVVVNIDKAEFLSRAKE